MSLGKKILGAFVELDEKPVVKKSSTPITASRTPTTITLGNMITPMATPSYGSNDFEVHQFREQFKRILDNENKKNFPGNDYYEFVVMKNAMSAIPQENIKYQAAFAGWMTGGNQTKDSLMKTANIYLGLVDREIAEFGEAYKHEYQQQVVKNEELINQKSAEVQKYAELIASLNNEISSLKQESQNTSGKLKSKYDSFMAAGNEQRQEILDEIDKIKQYIN